MQVHLLTIHPPLCRGPLDESILGRAQAAGLVRVDVLNIRDFARDKHQMTDDYPYGGGAGLVMKPEPVWEAVERAVAEGPCAGAALPPSGGDLRVILMDPQGATFTQPLAWELSRAQHLVLICGRYEGMDERVRSLVSDEISIGDYVLTGGELPALVVIDAVVRLIPGVLGDATSPVEESFNQGLLEGPQYTRPPVYRGMAVPEELLSGDHAAVARWRRKEALRRTLRRRPDLLQSYVPDQMDRELLDELWWEEAAAERDKPWR